MTPRRMDPELRRGQLLDAAAAWIAEHGVDVSLDDIAHSVGISPPLMRHYFRNRDGLLEALVDRMLPQLLGIFDASTGLSSTERLTLYLQAIAASPWAHRLWMNALHNEMSISPSIRRMRTEMVHLAVGKEWTHASTPERLRAEASVAATESAVSRWIDEQSPSLGELAEILVDIARRLGLPHVLDVPRDITTARATSAG